MATPKISSTGIYLKGPHPKMAHTIKSYSPFIRSGTEVRELGRDTPPFPATHILGSAQPNIETQKATVGQASGCSTRNI